MIRRPKPKTLKQSSQGAISPRVIALAALLILAGCSRNESKSGSEDSQTPSLTNQAKITTLPAEAAPSIPTNAGVPSPKAPVQDPPAATTSGGESGKLVSILTFKDASGAAITPEQMTRWRESLQGLVHQGAAGIPAIVEFLQKNEDVDFGPSGTAALGYPSARRALLDVLFQIGGVEGTGALLQVMQQSADPREMVVLADYLAELPGDHQPVIVQSVNEVLGLATGGKLPGEDVGPLFAILQKHGDENVVADLEKQSAQWKYYSAIALANLPNGAGVPSLVKMVEENGENKLTALQLLAQAAHDNPMAKDVLLDQAGKNGISANTWPYLVDALAGREFHYSATGEGPGALALTGEDIKQTSIKFGNQNFYTAPNTSATPEMLQARQSIIADLKRITADPAGIKALEDAEKDLSRRLSKVNPQQ